VTVAARGGLRKTNRTAVTECESTGPRAAPAVRLGLQLALALGLAVNAAHAQDGPLRLYVSDETGGNVVIVDPQTRQVLTRIAVGKRPRGIQISPDHERVYVALTGSPMGGPNVDESKLPPPDHRYDGIGVVDLKTQRLLTTYRSGVDPETFALSHDGKWLYVSNEDSGQLSAVDLASGRLTTTIAVGSEPEGVAVSDDDRWVYVTCETSNAVYVVDAHTMKVRAQIPTQKRPRALYLAAESQEGFVTDEFGAALTAFSTQNFKPTRTLSLGDPKTVRPMGIASNDGRVLYVTTGRYGALLEVDAQKGTILRKIDKVGARPWGLALSADGATAYTANGPGGDVSVVDLNGGRVSARIKTGGSPWGVVLAPAP
jgi:YVTN family beta-propeller protein